MRIIIFALIYFIANIAYAENSIKMDIRSIETTINNTNIEINFVIKNTTNKAFQIRRPLNIDGYFGQNGVDLKLIIGNKSILFPIPGFGITETIYKYNLEPKEIFYGKIKISKFYLTHILLENNALDQFNIGFQLFSYTLNNELSFSNKRFDFYSNIFYINESLIKYKDIVKEYLDEDSTNLLILFLPMINYKNDIDDLEFLPNYKVKDSESNNDISNWMEYALIKKNYYFDKKINNIDCLNKINNLNSKIKDIELKNRLLYFKESITNKLK